MSGTNGGIWRSEDTGKTWLSCWPAMRPTWSSIRTAARSSNPTTGTRFRATSRSFTPAIRRRPGVYMSPNQGQVWNLHDRRHRQSADHRRHSTWRNVNPITNPTPNGAGGRIVLAVPQPTGNAVKMPSTRAGSMRRSPPLPATFDGLFVTKDFGQNWTQVCPPPPNPLSVYQHGHTDQRHHAGRLTRSTLEPGQLYLTPDRRPHQPQYRLPGRLRRRRLHQRHGLIRVDTTEHLGCPLPGRRYPQLRR